MKILKIADQDNYVSVSFDPSSCLLEKMKLRKSERSFMLLT